MTRRTWLTLGWTLAILTVWLVIYRGREAPLILEGPSLDLRCEGWRHWTWTFPPALDSLDRDVIDAVDGGALRLLALVVLIAGWLSLRAERKVLGLVLDRVAITWLCAVGLTLGTVGLLLVWLQGPWAPLEERYRLSAWSLVAVYANKAVLGPVLEEMIFRGGLQGGLERLTGRTGAAMSTAFVFVALHATGSNTETFVLMLGAVSMSFLRWKTGSLWVCIVLHVAGNAFLITMPLWFRQIGG